MPSRTLMQNANKEYSESKVKSVYNSEAPSEAHMGQRCGILVTCEGSVTSGHSRSVSGDRRLFGWKQDTDMIKNTNPAPESASGNGLRETEARDTC